MRPVGRKIEYCVAAARRKVLLLKILVGAECDVLKEPRSEHPAGVGGIGVEVRRRAGAAVDPNGGALATKVETLTMGSLRRQAGSLAGPHMLTVL